MTSFGGATLDGSVTRNANFTLTGAEGATYAMTTPSVGQTLTRCGTL